jgi:N-terminal acetyltransferase B complex non-catalytic subunit
MLRIFILLMNNIHNATVPIVSFGASLLVKHRFGHLACFTSDVEVFLEVLTHDKKTQFLEKLMKISESDATVSTKVLGQSITLFKVQELIGKIYRLPKSGRSLAF